jgi:endonuclease/exonuclease/phosphatase family metal-dependent hydrolase
LTANLWNGGADALALGDVIDLHAPDVVLTQEMTARQAQAIGDRLPHGMLLPSDDTRGMGIALRHPGTVVRLGMPHRDALVAQLDGGGWDTAESPIEVINVHFSAPTELSRFALRHRQVRAVVDHITARPRRRVLAGDFNSLPIMPAYLTLTRHLSDAAHAGGMRPSPTWSPRAAWPRLLRIDHVLCSGLRVEALKVLRIRPLRDGTTVCTHSNTTLVLPHGPKPADNVETHVGLSRFPRGSSAIGREQLIDSRPCAP